MKKLKLKQVIRKEVKNVLNEQLSDRQSATFYKKFENVEKQVVGLKPIIKSLSHAMNDPSLIVDFNNIIKEFDRIGGDIEDWYDPRL